MHRSQQLCILILLLVEVLSFVGNLGANAAQQNVEVSAPQAARLSPNSISIDQTSTNSTSTNETTNITLSSTSTSNQTSTQTTTSFIGIPSISLNPSSASVGATVYVSGTNFLATDSACTLSGSAVGASSSCMASGGSLLGSFHVANVAPGSYTVKLTGSPSGDFATAALTVSGSSNSNGPSITLNTISAAVGT